MLYELGSELQYSLATKSETAEENVGIGCHSLGLVSVSLTQR